MSEQGRQMLGSLSAALALVVGVVLLVAWRIGPDGVPSEAREETLEERFEDTADEGSGRRRGRRGRD